MQQDFGEKGQGSVNDTAVFINDVSCFARGTELKQDGKEGSLGHAQSFIRVIVGTREPEHLGLLEMLEMT